MGLFSSFLFFSGLQFVNARFLIASSIHAVEISTLAKYPLVVGMSLVF